MVPSMSAMKAHSFALRGRCGGALSQIAAARKTSASCTCFGNASSAGVQSGEDFMDSGTYARGREIFFGVVIRLFRITCCDVVGSRSGGTGRSSSQGIAGCSTCAGRRRRLRAMSPVTVDSCWSSIIGLGMIWASVSETSLNGRAWWSCGGLTLVHDQDGNVEAISCFAPGFGRDWPLRAG